MRTNALDASLAIIELTFILIYVIKVKSVQIYRGMVSIALKEVGKLLSCSKKIQG